ncbi:TetR/AcrR family transcriptional regulator [Glaciibacter superstes]|uniref:TetR/AcrR family transcriptional regulator n=1 Tax=Glaciibacter superstes TaxID=501023 RepID=UPI0003B52AAF|nr:TetR-like C-terminal domain-containing protein [Glaciibacter superstes]
MPRAGLSRSAVNVIALDLVDEGGTNGFGALTLAAVATRAGVAVPSLYKHVVSLGDLRRLVAVASVTEFRAAIEAASIGRAGPDALRAVADAMRTFAHRYPGRYAASQIAADPTDPADAELAAAGAEAVTAFDSVLRGFGLAPGGTVDAVRVLRSGLHGFIVLELGGGFRMPDDLDRSFEVLVDTLIAGIERLAT